ncbi:DNA internalization-related competence protein ComEC/Rec2 [Nitrospira sp.]|nr:DNA internalization-related competence protein ComEC/Rec2 [Nitrospira sp.]
MLPRLTAWFIIGLVAGSFVQHAPVLILAVLTFTAAGFALRERAEGLPRGSSTAAYGALLVGTLYWSLFTVILSPAPPVVPDSEDSISIRGRIVAPVSTTPDRIIAIVAPLDSPERPHVRKLRLTWRMPDAGLVQGDVVVAFTSRVSAPHGTHNPGAFDYESHLRRRDIDALASVSGAGAVQVIEAGSSSWRWAPWSGIDRWRQQIYAAAVESLSPSTQGLFLGLVIGEQGLIETQRREDFIATGTVHILSISGSHLGLISVVAFLFVRWSCRWLPTTAILTLNRHRLSSSRIAACLTVPLTGTYALLAGGEIATLRALFMILLLLLALWLGREKRLLPVLSAAALVTLIEDPRVLYDVSFQLSYVAVLGLALMADRRRARSDEGLPPEEEMDRTTIRQRAWRWGVDTLKLSLVVTVVTFPLVAWHFHQFPWIGPVANLVLLPMTALLIPLCLGSAVVLILGGPAEALPLAWIVDPALRLMEQSLTLLAMLPAVNWHVAAPSLLTLLVYFGLLALLAHPAVMPIRRVAATSCLVLLILWWLTPHRTLPDDAVRVTMIDVGQGDATLIEMPNGETVLIDAGTSHERFDVGARIVAPLLWDRGITHLDHAIGTHPQLDHIGGFPWLLRHFEVRHYWSTPMTRQEPFFVRLQEALRERGLSPLIPENESILASGGPCRLVALNRSNSHSSVVHTVRSSRNGTDLNNASLVTRLDCTGYTMLFPADMETAGLTQMMTTGSVGAATVIKVPHHGARSSLNELWLHTVRPQVAVLSAGAHNPYRHPAQEVLAAYRRANVPLFRTDRDGAVTLTGSLIAPTISLTTTRQGVFEAVPLTHELWSAERRNYRRLCQRYFESSCPLLG